jgi:serine protease Do
MSNQTASTTRSMTPTRLVLALAAAGMLGGASVSVITGLRANAAVPAVAAPTATLPAAAPVALAPLDFSKIAAQQGKAVVNITVSGMQRVSANDADNNSDDEEDAAPAPRGKQQPANPMQEFFRRFHGQIPGMPNMPGLQRGPQTMPVLGQGSGFIVSADGLILTNAHVVRGAKEVVVKLTDRREFTAKVLGSDARTDIAVLRIEARNLPMAALGSTRDLAVGEWVLAIGSPYGFENSVSAGVVSAKGRSLPDDSQVPFIQTDVAVNPGNSGGPLFNSRGEVVGINSQIYSRSGGYQGISFAIPIDVATRVKDQIVATGKASHARLGVVVQEVNQALADSFKLERPEGALVSNVDPSGPAAKASLQAGDVIRQVNGQPVVASGDLPAIIGQAVPGQQVSIDIWRQGKAQQLTAKLADANAKATQVAGGDDGQAGAPDRQARLGLALRPLQPQERREAGLAAGLVVENASGPAARAGVQPGDVLVAVNGTPVQTAEQVKEAVGKSGKSAALLIVRDGSRIFVPVRLG